MKETGGYSMDTQNRLGRGLSSLIPDATVLEEEKEFGINAVFHHVLIIP